MDGILLLLGQHNAKDILQSFHTLLLRLALDENLAVSGDRFSDCVLKKSDITNDPLLCFIRQHPGADDRSGEKTTFVVGRVPRHDLVVLREELGLGETICWYPRIPTLGSGLVADVVAPEFWTTALISRVGLCYRTQLESEPPWRYAGGLVAIFKWVREVGAH